MLRNATAKDKVLREKGERRYLSTSVVQPTRSRENKIRNPRFKRVSCRVFIPQVGFGGWIHVLCVSQREIIALFVDGDVFEKLVSKAMSKLVSNECERHRMDAHVAHLSFVGLS